MKAADVKKLLGILGATGIREHGKWIQATCPFAPWKHEHGTDRKPSFGILTGVQSRYKCYSCNSSGNVAWMILELDSLGLQFPVSEALQLTAKEDTDDIEIDAPESYEAVTVHKEAEVIWPEAFLKTFKVWSSVPVCIDYLSKRIPDPLISDFLDLRYDTQKQRVCFPLRNWEGKLVGLHGRDVTGKHEIKYYAYRYQGTYHSTIWLGEQWVDLSEPVILVESVFDLAAVLPFTKNVMTPLMAGISKAKAMRINGAQEIITLFDRDKAGDTARQAISRWLDWIPVTHLKLPEGIKDPGEAPPEILKKMLKHYV